ncbi:head-to-tail stopper [Pseudomonas phage vB_Pa-PAC4]
MARFDSAIALAKKLIKKNGQAVTLRGFTTNAAPDPAKPWKPGGNVAADQTIEAVFLDYEQRYIDGQTIRMGDQRVFMPAESLTAPPEVEGLVLRGLEVWKVIAVKPLNPNGQAIMYELQVRQ